MLAASRIALVHVAKRALALGEDDYRQILSRHGGATSAKNLDQRGFDAVMDRFRALGFTSTTRKRSFGVRAGMASPAQIATIRNLWASFAREPTEANLNTFIEHAAKVSALRFLDAHGAAAVITALKAMVARKDAANAGRGN